MRPSFARLRRTVLGLVWVAVALLWAGCGKAERRVEAAARNNTLLLGNGADPADLDPPGATAFTDMNIIMALFEGLTAIDEQTTLPVPAAAERWEQSADGLTWTFHLRNHATWSNGEPLTADDFVQSFRRTVSPALAFENAAYLFALKNAEAINGGKITDFAQLGCAAPDAQTLVLTLERPTPHLPLLTALTPWYPINPRALAPHAGMTRRGTAWTRPGNLVGNGPFTLAEWDPNTRVAVTRNPRYWNAAHTKLQRIEFYPIEQPDTEERNFRAGQLHVTFSLPVAKVARWRERDPARLRTDPFLQTVFISFNTQRPPLNDPRVRQALSLAIDRGALTRTALAGSRNAAPSATPPGTGGYTARAQVGHGVARARALLAEAGFGGGVGFPTLSLQVRNEELQPTVAEAVQAMWREALGVNVTLTPLEQKTWLQNQRTLNFAISTYSWVGDFPDPLTFLANFTSNNGNNWTGWSDAEYDGLIAEASGLADAAQRHERFQRAEARLLEALPLTPIYYGAQTYLIDPMVKNWPTAPLGSRRYQFIALER